jgi:hypothetical protein
MVSPAWGVEVNSGSRDDSGGPAPSVLTLTSNASSRTERTRDKVLAHVE